MQAAYVQQVVLSKAESKKSFIRKILGAFISLLLIFWCLCLHLSYHEMLSIKAVFRTGFPKMLIYKSDTNLLKITLTQLWIWPRSISCHMEANYGEAVKQQKHCWETLVLFLALGGCWVSQKNVSETGDWKKIGNSSLNCLYLLKYTLAGL